MLRIALCDDEEYISKEVYNCLIKYQASGQSDEEFAFELRYFANAEDVLASDYFFDILILDIMLDGREGHINGIELGKQLRQRRCKAYFIILSSMPAHKQGYSAGVIRFLDKPLNYNDFAEALDAIQLDIEVTEQHISVTFRRMKITVRLSEIAYIQTYNRQREIVLNHGSQRCSEDLDELEKILPENFIRVNTSYIINIAYVDYISKTQIKMHDGAIIPFQRGKLSKYELVSHAFNKYALEVK